MILSEKMSISKWSPAIFLLPLSYRLNVNRNDLIIIRVIYRRYESGERNIAVEHL
jgi:hypothetical protein